MKKRFVIIFTAILICICGGFTAFAEENAVTIEPYGDFFVYGTDSERVAEILGMTADGLDGYVKDNNIIYLAVDEKNSKQIKVDSIATDFSSSVINLSLISNDKINALMPDIIGIEGIKGEIIKKNGQKFIKTQLSSTDSGGGYNVTQYITVADKRVYILNLYNDCDADTEYIEKTFETYNVASFIDQATQKKDGIKAVIIAATVVFAAISVIIAITIAVDIAKSKKEID